jgi:hypothetical protein
MPERPNDRASGRYPAPWRAIRAAGAYIVVDAKQRHLAHVYFHVAPDIAGTFREDEAKVIAQQIARLPEFVHFRKLEPPMRARTPPTVADVINEGRGITATCHRCGHSRTLDLFALLARGLGDCELTSLRLKCQAEVPDPHGPGLVTCYSRSVGFRNA